MLGDRCGAGACAGDGLGSTPLGRYGSGHGRRELPNFPCPCCGHRVFDEPPGSYAICQVCSWEDDAVQLRWPDWQGGANDPSLIKAQQTYALVATPHLTARWARGP